MKVSKDAIRTARQLLKASFSNGSIDSARAKQFVSQVAEKKPRGYLAILSVYLRLIRLEMEKRHAVVESAHPLNGSLRDGVIADLKSKYGEDLTMEFQTTEELVGGMRVRVGSDVWDGSVRGRLDRLADQLS